MHQKVVLVACKIRLDSDVGIMHSGNWMYEYACVIEATMVHAYVWIIKIIIFMNFVVLFIIW
jgi:hypothetical protein